MVPFLQIFWPKLLMRFSRNQWLLLLQTISVFFDSVMLIMYGGRYKSWRSSSRDLLQLHITSSLISSNMSLKTINLCSPLKLKAGLCVHEVSVSLARKNASLWAPIHVMTSWIHDHYSREYSVEIGFRCRESPRSVCRNSMKGWTATILAGCPPT
jgi:hypothetical protein